MHSGVGRRSSADVLQPAIEIGSEYFEAVPRLRPLNVVVVTVDTLRPDHLHCYGNANIETPALDGIAQRGVLFENAVAQTPLTPPSHASIFTGQNPNVHNVRNTGGFVLQSSARPLARILQEQGWDTAAFVGSAVLKKVFGFNNGFNRLRRRDAAAGPAKPVSRRSGAQGFRCRGSSDCMG